MESPNPYAAPTADVRDVVPDDAVALAGRGARLGAAIIDGLVMGLCVYVPAGIVAGFEQVATGGVLGMVDLPMAAIVTLCAGALVYGGITWYLVHKYGQTIGKRMVGIKVVRTDGSRAGVGRIFWMRNVPFYVVSVIPIVGWIVSLVDPLLIFRASRQTLHDQLADTNVVMA